MSPTAVYLELRNYRIIDICFKLAVAMCLIGLISYLYLWATGQAPVYNTFFIHPSGVDFIISLLLSVYFKRQSNQIKLKLVQDVLLLKQSTPIKDPTFCFFKQCYKSQVSKRSELYHYLCQHYKLAVLINKPDLTFYEKVLYTVALAHYCHLQEPTNA